MPIGRVGQQDFQVSTTTTVTHSEPWITTLADGRYLVIWHGPNNSDYEVFSRLFNADGSPAGDDFQVNTTTTEGQGNVSATALSDGRVFAVWQSNDSVANGFDIRGRLFDGGGNPIGDDFLINTTLPLTQEYPVATALPDGRIFVTWGSSGDVRGRFLASDGTPIGNDFIVAGGSTTEQWPTVTALANGRILVTWTRLDGVDYDVRGRLFNADGSPTGNDFPINSTTSNEQYLASVTELPNGRLFVTWSSNNGADYDIRGRVFNANGTPVANDFLISTTTAGYQDDSHVTVLPDGRLVVVWISLLEGAQYEIRGRVFDASGVGVGEDFRISNTATASSFPGVTTLANGNVVVTWSSSGQIYSATLDPTVFVGTTGEDNWRGSNVFGDRINGGVGNDTLSGLGGNDLINGDGGSDTLSGGDGNDRLFGGGDSDTLDGGAGNDTMHGGTGADTMRGRSGNDLYSVDNAGDVVIEANNEGTDTVESSVTFSLAGKYIENLNLTGSGNINGTGNSLNNTIRGNSANNIIDGGTGADRMEGGGGDDRYYVDNAGDVVVEASGNGNDRVVSTVSFNLSGQYIERLTLDGTANISGTGNSQNNGITGNSGNNTLNGGTGNDTLEGGGGTDTLNGQAGDDTLTGGTGADFFVFNTALSASTNVDTITDFQVNVDKMRLENAIFTAVGAGLTADEFVANTSGTATNSAQHILYDTTDGRLYYDPDGNGAQARIHFATLDAGLALDHLDFVVI